MKTIKAGNFNQATDGNSARPGTKELLYQKPLEAETNLVGEKGKSPPDDGVAKNNLATEK